MIAPTKVSWFLPHLVITRYRTTLVFQGKECLQTSLNTFSAYTQKVKQNLLTRIQDKTIKEVFTREQLNKILNAFTNLPPSLTDSFDYLFIVSLLSSLINNFNEYENIKLSENPFLLPILGYVYTILHLPHFAAFNTIIESLTATILDFYNSSSDLYLIPLKLEDISTTFLDNSISAVAYNLLKPYFAKTYKKLLDVLSQKCQQYIDLTKGTKSFSPYKVSVIVQVSCSKFGIIKLECGT